MSDPPAPILAQKIKYFYLFVVYNLSPTFRCHKFILNIYSVGQGFWSFRYISSHLFYINIYTYSTVPTSFFSNDRQDEINQLARRRSILTRISTDRYAAPLDTPERYRLEEACKKAVVSLAESASHVLQSNALSSYSNSSVSSPDASSSSITITTDSDININTREGEMCMQVRAKGDPRSIIVKIAIIEKKYRSWSTHSYFWSPPQSARIRNSGHRTAGDIGRRWSRNCLLCYRYKPRMLW